MPVRLSPPSRGDREQVFDVLDRLSTDPDEELAEIASDALSEYLLWDELPSADDEE